MLAPWKESYDKTRQYIKKQRHPFVDEGPCSQSCGISSSPVRMWELEHKEGWVLKNWYFRIMVLEKTLESPLDCKEMKPVNPQGNQPWIFTGRTDAEAEALIFDHLMWRADSLEETMILGKTEGRRRRGQQWWDGWLLSLTWVWANLGDNEGQGSLACCSPRACKELDKTQQLNNSRGVTWLFLPHSSG